MGKWVDTGGELTAHFLALAAADRADMLKDDGTGNAELSDFVPEVLVLTHVNLELAALWAVLIKTHEDYLVYRRFIDIKANQENYVLPEDFYKFRKVFPIVNGKRGRALKRFDLKDLGAADSSAPLMTSPVEDTRYKVTGSRLWLHPTPTTDVTEGLELWYVPQFHMLRNAGDLVPNVFPNGWEEYVIEGVAARMLEKEESDASAQRARQKEILQRILIMAEDRDVGEPFQMQDTEGYL
jgi:hypothetical protein